MCNPKLPDNVWVTLFIYLTLNEIIHCNIFFIKTAKKTEEKGKENDKISEGKNDKSEEEVASRLQGLSVTDTNTESKDSSSDKNRTVENGEGGGDNRESNDKRPDKTQSPGKE